MKNYKQKKGIAHNSEEYLPQMKAFSGVDRCVKNSPPPLDDVGSDVIEILDAKDLTNTNLDNSQEKNIGAIYNPRKATMNYGTKNTTEDDQRFALMRCSTIIEGHLQDKFTNPEICHLFFQMWNILEPFVRGK